MAAIAEAASARFAPCWAMRALLRVLVFGGLVAMGWLLGSGTGHADEDPGLPGTGLIQAVDAAYPAGGSTGSHLTGSVVAGALSAVPVPRIPAESPLRVGILRHVVDAVDLPKPLTGVLDPVARPLSGTASSHGVANRSLVHVSQPVRITPVSVPAFAPAAVRTAGLSTAPASHTAHPVPLCSPAYPAAAPVIIQPAADESGPANPTPLSPPVDATSACLADGATAGGAGDKGGPDLAAHRSPASPPLASPQPLSLSYASDLPRSLSEEPSTSPD
ncbi:MAG TPA: hypothetical protein VFO16_24960 [Pseudonocardiaceae bacterium]|nr:hypothetical protein [Pseudonocardiaceae bacterium]